MGLTKSICVVFIPCPSVRQVAVLGLYLSALFSLYLVPLGMYSPCIKEPGTLGPAPNLIGHRGAPMVRFCWSSSSTGVWKRFLTVCVCSWLQRTPWCPLRKQWRLEEKDWRLTSPSGNKTKQHQWILFIFSSIFPIQFHLYSAKS